MTAKGVDLATISFPTQKAATQFFGEMLARYRPGDQVNAEDAWHLAALLECHTEREEKIGCGVDHFEVVWADYGTQCFHVVQPCNRYNDCGARFSAKTFYQKVCAI